jgi:2-C-methyl-D-erythritol 4-phosphate cytidylyltransferase
VRFAVIPSAGLGRRFGGKKQFFEMNGKLIVEFPLSVFQASKLIDGIILVLPKEDILVGERLREKYPKITKVVVGGTERQESVYNGLKAINQNVKEVIVHDGVRPFIFESTIESLVESFQISNFDGLILGVKPKETVKEIKGNHLVKKTLNRDSLILVQTPQIFKFPVLLDSHEKAREENFLATDDSALLERYGYTVGVVEGDYRNIKITTPEDLEIAKLFLSFS